MALLQLVKGTARATKDYAGFQPSRSGAVGKGWKEYVKYLLWVQDWQNLV
jgi:hypothetical protein